MPTQHLRSVLLALLVAVSIAVRAWRWLCVFKRRHILYFCSTKFAVHSLPSFVLLSCSDGRCSFWYFAHKLHNALHRPFCQELHHCRKSNTCLPLSTALAFRHILHGHTVSAWYNTHNILIRIDVVSSGTQYIGHLLLLLLSFVFDNPSDTVFALLIDCNILSFPDIHLCSILSCSSSSPYHNPCFSPQRINRRLSAD